MADANATPANTSADTEVAWTITALVQEWIDGTANEGMLLKVSSESGTSHGSDFHSSDSVTAGKRPKLVINYTPPPSSGGNPMFFAGGGFAVG